MEVKVKIANGKISYKDKKDGSQKEIDCIVLEFPNGQKTNLISSRFNYRLCDYLTDLIKQG